MAEVNITVDTDNKKVDVNVGGKKVENVREIFVSSEENGGFFNLEIASFEEMEGMRKITRLMANKQKAEEAGDACKSKMYDGFYEVEDKGYTIDDIKNAIFNRKT